MSASGHETMLMDKRPGWSRRRVAVSPLRHRRTGIATATLLMVVVTILAGEGNAAGAVASPKPTASQSSLQSAQRFQARVAAEVAHLDWLGHDASPDSPARLRIQEQADALREQAATSDQLVYVLEMFSGATPGSPAQWRAWDSATVLAAELHTPTTGPELVGL